MHVCITGRYDSLFTFVRARRYVCINIQVLIVETVTTAEVVISVAYCCCNCRRRLVPISAELVSVVSLHSCELHPRYALPSRDYAPRFLDCSYVVRTVVTTRLRSAAHNNPKFSDGALSECYILCIRYLGTLL